MKSPHKVEMEEKVGEGRKGKDRERGRGGGETQSEGFEGQELMESLIFTCLHHTATHFGDVRLDPLELFSIFFAPHDQRKQVFLHKRVERS